MSQSNNGLNESICQSYLLRIWRDGEDSEWRAMLLTIPTQERHQFTSIESLFNFLEFRAGHPVSKAPMLMSSLGFNPGEEIIKHQP